MLIVEKSTVRTPRNTTVMKVTLIEANEIGNYSEACPECWVHLADTILGFKVLLKGVGCGFAMVRIL